MPTYQYVCTQCGQDLEVQQSFSDASLTECPACAGRLRKVFNAVGVVFKGSGFYRNDSRSGSSTDGGHKDAKESKDTKDSGSKSTESTGTKDSGSKESGSKSSDSTPKKSDTSSSTASKAPASTS